MHGKFLFTFLLSAPLLWGAPPSREIQEVRSTFQELSYRLNSHQTELDLLLERLNDMEKAPQQQNSEPRMSKVETIQKNLADDIKTLKGQIEKTNTALNKYQKQISSDIASLKNSLKSMITLLQQGGAERTYTVKPGDSLGKIALQNKVSTKALKEKNNLKSDTIVVGQKLTIPPS